MVKLQPARQATVRATESDFSRDELFDALRPVVRGIAETFGRNCEVLIHDFRDLTHSIVAIEGSVTGRQVGGSVTEIGLSMAAQGDTAEDRINYMTSALGGRVIKSSTILLRDGDGHVVGALCINVDVTDLRRATGVLEDLGGPIRSQPTPVAFVDDIQEVIRTAIEEVDHALVPRLDRGSKAYRLEVVRGLEKRGILALQKAVPLIADALGISRATAYSYLDEIRAADSGSRGGEPEEHH